MTRREPLPSIPRRLPYPMRPLVRRNVVGERGPELIRLWVPKDVVATTYRQSLRRS